MQKYLIHLYFSFCVRDLNGKGRETSFLMKDEYSLKVGIKVTELLLTVNLYENKSSWCLREGLKLSLSLYFYVFCLLGLA